MPHQQETAFGTKNDSITGELHAVLPQPVELDDTGSSNQQPIIGPNYKRLSTIASLLYQTQKYSSISFSIFTLLHGATVLVAPCVSVSLAEELLSITRTIYQAPGIEEILVWGSLGIHVLSGITLRLIRNIQYRMKYGQSKKEHRKSKKSELDRSLSIKAISVDPDGRINVNDDKQVGLAGGVTNIIGLGTKKSFSYRKFGMSPLQVSGYILIPFLTYHIFQTRLVPLLFEGDSSYVNFEFISYIFNDQLHALWGPIMNWIIYPSLTVLSVYHNIYGLLRWFNVKNLNWRKIGAMGINILIVSGIWSIYQISRIDTTSTMAFVLKKFDKYLDSFYFLRF